MATKDSDAELHDHPAEESTTAQRGVDLAGSERKLREVVATLRQSDIDIRDYMPDMATIVREAHPQRAEEKLREASLTPLPTTPLEDEGENSAHAEGAAPMGTSSPAADATPGGAAVDPMTLPSALAPHVRTSSARSADDHPSVVKASAAEAHESPRRVALAKGLGAALAVLAPLFMMYALLVRPVAKEHGDAGAGTASAATPSALTSATVPGAALPTSASVAPPPSVTVPATATAESAPQVPTNTPKRTKPRGTDDPYQNASPPSPRATATESPSVAPPPPAPATPPAAPASAKIPTDVY